MYNLFFPIRLQSIAMFYSALILDMTVSVMSSTTTMLVLTIAGGFYARNVPVWMRWVKYISYPQHVFYALSNIDLRSIDIEYVSFSLYSYKFYLTVNLEGNVSVNFFTKYGQLLIVATFMPDVYIIL